MIIQLQKDAGQKNGKIKYKCIKHGIIIAQILNNHLQGKGCKLCANEKRRNKQRMSNDAFFKKAKTSHNDLDSYDFSDFNANNRDSNENCDFICKKHGLFKMNPNYFLKGYGCPFCYRKVKNDDEIKEKLQQLHSNLDFSKADFSKKRLIRATIGYLPQTRGSKNKLL